MLEEALAPKPRAGGVVQEPLCNNATETGMVAAHALAFLTSSPICLCHRLAAVAKVIRSCKRRRDMCWA